MEHHFIYIFIQLAFTETYHVPSHGLGLHELGSKTTYYLIREIICKHKKNLNEGINGVYSV